MAFTLAPTQAPQHTWLNGGQGATARKYWLRSTQHTPTGPQISAVVAGMAPGDFEQINATASTFFRVQRADDGTAAAILDWTPTQVWHAATQQVLRGGRRGTFKLTAYSDVTGEEREMPCPFGRVTNGTAHFYGNICQDEAGNVYYGTTESVSQTWRLNPVTEAWTQLANTPSYSQLGSSMEWFPEANSGSGGVIKSLDFATSTLRVILLNAAGSSWSTLASGVPNSQHALLRYHPNHARVLILGGTNTQTAATFLEADGTATASSTAIPANIHGMSPACWVIAHPSGCWLVRSGASGRVYAAWPSSTYDDMVWVDLGPAPDAALSNPTVDWDASRGVVLLTAETGLFAWKPPALIFEAQAASEADQAVSLAGADNFVEAAVADEQAAGLTLIFSPAAAIQSSEAAAPLLIAVPGIAREGDEAASLAAAFEVAPGVAAEQAVPLEQAFEPGIAVEAGECLALSLLAAVSAATSAEVAIGLGQIYVPGIAVASDIALAPGVSAAPTPNNRNIYRRAARDVLAGRVANTDGAQVMLKIGARRRRY